MRRDWLAEMGERGNLAQAFWKAARGKARRADVRAFKEQFDENLSEVGGRIVGGEGPVGRFTEFEIRDPKLRRISAPCFEDRVFHHAVMNIVEPALERFQIFDSYACRVGKGQFRAIERACRFAGQGDWFVKMDVKHYFEIIPRGKLLERLEKRLRSDQLVALFGRILESWEPGRERGLPIGALVSQHLANFYLGHLDHEVKDEMGVKGYLRYMDDFVLWGTDKNELKAQQERVGGFCENQLGLELKPWFLNRSQLGMDFLGYRVFPWRAGLSRGARDRLKAKWLLAESQFEAGELSEAE